jgi:circadian clock protein KaiC
MLLRLIDDLVAIRITALFSHTRYAGERITDVGVSSLMDVRLLLLNCEVYGRHVREIYVLRSRGMARSDQVHEFSLSEREVSIGREITAGGSA